MKRITEEEAKNNYKEIHEGDPFRIQRATAFRLVPIPDEPGWEEVIYYEHKDAPPYTYISRQRNGTRMRVDYIKNKK